MNCFSYSVAFGIGSQLTIIEWNFLKLSYKKTAFCHRHLNTGRVIYFNTQNPICYRTYICNQLSKAERIPCWASRTAGYKYNRKWLIPSIPKEKRKLEHPSDKLPESVPAWISNLGFRPQSSCFLACSYYQGINLFLFWKMFVICNVWKFSCLVKPFLTPPSYAVNQVKIIKYINKILFIVS